MQLGQSTLIKSIIYLLLKIATIFSKKNNFFKYELIFKHDKKKSLLQIYNLYLKKLNINIL
ncbi:hypothetical protein C6B38_08275 [Spiroplasma sp. ChiS]|nr:hypothetical protein C6B38_08275 [Spiroplasma sp. ChiS]